MFPAQELSGWPRLFLADDYISMLRSPHFIATMLTHNAAGKQPILGLAKAPFYRAATWPIWALSRMRAFKLIGVMPRLSGSSASLASGVHASYIAADAWRVALMPRAFRIFGHRQNHFTIVMPLDGR